MFGKNSKLKLLQFFTTFWILLFLSPFALPVSAAEETDVLQVPFSEVNGFSMTDEDGNRSGIIYDYLKEIAKYTGWKYEFIDTTGEAMVNDFMNGKYDLMGGTYYSEQSEEYFGYPKYNCGYAKAVLLTTWENEEILGYNLDDMNGKTIGVVQRAKENIRRLKEYLSANALECTLREYSPEEISKNQMNTDLTNGVIDMKLGNASDNTGEFRAVASFDSQSHYIVTHPDNKELLDKLNWALEQILSANPNFANEVYDRNVSDSNVYHVPLTSDEKNYINNKGTVTVAVPEYFHPFYCNGVEDGNHIGIVPDLLDRISEMYGLKFSYVYMDSYADTLQLVLQGDADMAGFFLSDSVKESDTGLISSSSYATMNDLVVRNKSVSYPTEGLTCGMLEGREIPSYVSASNVKYYHTVYDVLEAVNTREVDFACGLSAHMEQILQDNVFNNVVPVTLSESRLDISFAMRMPADPQLLTIINKGINSISQSEKLAILDHNLVSIGFSSHSLKRFIETNPVMAVSIIAAFLILIVTAIAIISNMRIKAANMQKEVAKASAESKAKSEFLSRMSHEIRTPMNAIVGTTALMNMKEDVPENIKTNLTKLNASSQYLLGLINDILDMSRIDSGMLEITKEHFSLKQMLDELHSMMQAQAQRNHIQLSCIMDIEHSDLTGDSIRLKQVLMNLLSNAIKFTPAGGKVKLSVKETGADDSGAMFSFRVTDTGVGIEKEDLKRIFESFEQVGSSHIRSQGTGLGLPISRNIVHLMGGELKVKSTPNKGSDFYFSITLPFGEPEDTSSSEVSSELFAQSRFLLAEDNPINADIAIELLKLQGAQVELAADGVEAVEKFKQSPPGYYTLILMDIQMPKMGGLEATRIIRACEHPDAADIPVIALTANSFQEDKDMARDAGMNDFLAKPLDIKHVYSILAKWITKNK